MIFFIKLTFTFCERGEKKLKSVKKWGWLHFYMFSLRGLVCFNVSCSGIDFANLTYGKFEPDGFYYL